MTAYVIVDIEVTDPAGYEDYKKLAAPTVAAYGGKYIVRGGAVETLDAFGGLGDPSPRRAGIRKRRSRQAMAELARVQRRPAIAAQDCAVEDDCCGGGVAVA